MESAPLILTDLPELTDESAAQLLDFLYTFVNEFENHYYPQLHRYYQSQEAEQPEPPQEDLFANFDEIPPF